MLTIIFFETWRLMCAIFFLLQLKACNSLYEGHVPMKYKHYCKKMKKYALLWALFCLQSTSMKTVHAYSFVFNYLWIWISSSPDLGNGETMSHCKQLLIRWALTFIVSIISLLNWNLANFLQWCRFSAFYITFVYYSYFSRILLK